MYRPTLILTASLILSCFIDGKTSFGSDENSSSGTKTTVSPSGETRQEHRALQQLAVALTAGGSTWSSFHRAKVTNEEAKHPLDPTIPDMDCRVDEIAYYVSCYGAPTASKKEADRRFTGLIDELQAVLQSDRWKGVETQPGIDSIRSYTYKDRNSDAHIDIDLDAQLDTEGEFSYFVTIFGWAATEPQL